MTLNTLDCPSLCHLQGSFPLKGTVYQWHFGKFPQRWPQYRGIIAFLMLSAAESNIVITARESWDSLPEDIDY